MDASSEGKSPAKGFAYRIPGSVLQNCSRSVAQLVEPCRQVQNRSSVRESRTNSCKVKGRASRKRNADPLVGVIQEVGGSIPLRPVQLFGGGSSVGRAPD